MQYSTTVNNKIRAFPLIDAEPNVTTHNTEIK